MAMNRNKLVVLLGFLAAVPLAAACGGSSAVTSAPVRAGAPAAAGVQAQSNAAAPAKAPAQQPQNGVSVPAQVVPVGPRLQISAQLTLEVPDGRFDATFNDVMAIVT